MKFIITYTKYENSGNSNQNKYGFCTDVKNKLFVNSLFTFLIDNILKYKYWEMPGIVGMFKNELICSFDDFDIVIKATNSLFDFDLYNKQIYHEFEKIRGGII